MRKSNSVKNFLTIFIPYILLLLLGFIRIRVFINSLGEEIYALNQLFLQLFAYISLAEAGIGTLISQLYYKQFASGNKKEICNLYTYSIRLMKKIALITFIIGLIVSFFLQILTNNNLTLLYMQLVFMLFILRCILEYLTISPRMVIEADQKVYKINVLLNFYKVLEILFEIYLLYLKIDYIYILIVTIIIRLLSYYLVNRKVFKEYPWLKQNKTLEKGHKVRNIKSIFIYRVAEAVHYNTDIILLSSISTPLIVTIYSSYNYISKYLSDSTDLIGTSLSASYGNVLYKDEKEKQISIFKQINILYFFIASLFSIMFYCLVQSFVNLWLESNKLMDITALIFFTICLFLTISRKGVALYRNAKGLYKETVKISVLEAATNLILSILLIKNYGLIGVIFATMISMLISTTWYLPYFIMKREFNLKPYSYYFKLIIIFILSIILCYISSTVISTINITNYIEWITLAVVVGLLILFILTSFFYLSFKEFRLLCASGISYLKNLFNKKSSSKIIEEK